MCRLLKSTILQIQSISKVFFFFGIFLFVAVYCICLGFFDCTNLGITTDVVYLSVVYIVSMNKLVASMYIYIIVLLFTAQA